MSDPVFNIASATPVQMTSGPAATTTDVSSSEPASGGTGQTARPATRAYVDRGSDGVYIYRLVDVATGRVLAELPRSEGASPKLSADYAPGAVASASA